MEITDAMRAAVLAEQCEARGGHTPTFQTALTTGARTADDISMVLGGPDGRAPHAVCSFCGRVFLILADGAPDYDTAEADLIDRLGDDDLLAVRLRAARLLRQQPDVASSHG